MQSFWLKKKSPKSPAHSSAISILTHQEKFILKDWLVNTVIAHLKDSLRQMEIPVDKRQKERESLASTGGEWMNRCENEKNKKIGSAR